MKSFRIELNGKKLIDLDLYGDDDLVEEFCKTTLLGTFGTFHEVKDAFADLIIHEVSRQKTPIRDRRKVSHEK